MQFRSLPALKCVVNTARNWLESEKTSSVGNPPAWDGHQDAEGAASLKEPEYNLSHTRDLERRAASHLVTGLADDGVAGLRPIIE